MKAVMYGVIGLCLLAVAEFLREQLTPKPVQLDSSGVEYNTSTWDNSYYATSEAQAYGPFQPTAPQVPNTPYGWTQFEAENNGGVVPPTAGIPPYST